MSKETLNILNVLSKKKTTDLTLGIMKLTADNMVKDKEIERLNKRVKELEENLSNMLNISIEDNNIIAEAIEYIEQQYKYEETAKEDYDILLDILKGDDKVEIIGEDKKIEKINAVCCLSDFEDNQHFLVEYLETMKNRINEIIDKLNKEER